MQGLHKGIPLGKIAEVGVGHQIKGGGKLWMVGLILAEQGRIRGMQQLGVRDPGQTLAQKGAVGGVFQQTTDQVGHAGDQVPIGTVDPYPVSGFDQGFGQFVRHAIEHLQLKAAGGDA